jgi:hypothetical protein
MAIPAAQIIALILQAIKNDLEFCQKFFGIPELAFGHSRLINLICKASYCRFLLKEY